MRWGEAMDYYFWLGEQLRGRQGTPRVLAELLNLGRRLALPSEAEWEKGARGTDGRIFPWGDDPDPNKANCSESGLGAASPVGIFAGGAGPYGLLDMSGNTWEWTRSLWGRVSSVPESYGRYPYAPEDEGREDLNASDELFRVVRGGSFDWPLRRARCAIRGRYQASGGGWRLGFRVALCPSDRRSGHAAADS